MSSQAGQPLTVYVGTFTATPPRPRGRAEGIYVYHFDTATGALTHAHTIPGVENPAFLALAPDRPFLYAVNESSAIDGHAGGAVSAFAIDPVTAGLTFLNRQPSGGADPCFVGVEPAGRGVLVANYGGGSVALLPVERDGRLGTATAFHQHAGSSVDPQRQAGPHAHSIVADSAGRYALAPDLGLDRVLVYRLDAAAGTLTPHDPPAALFPAGSGPRHLDFHPSAPYVYVINELASTLTACQWDGERGVLRPFQTLSTLPAGFTGRNSCADVHVAPSGRFVYGSNRGHDSIAIFAIDGATGALTALGYEPTGGQNPRNFAIDPTGAFLLAANQDSDTIVIFRLDAETGLLAATGQMVAVPSPVCLRFVPPEA